MNKWKEAGEGDHHVYHLVPPNQTTLGPLEPEHDYIGVDSSSWFLNKESSWFRERTASGVMRITLASGQEEYNAALISCQEECVWNRRAVVCESHARIAVVKRFNGTSMTSMPSSGIDLPVSNESVLGERIRSNTDCA